MSPRIASAPWNSFESRTPGQPSPEQMAIRQMTDFEKLKSHIEMTVTAEGLRIELSESASGTFFDSGSAKLNGDGSRMLITLAQELGKLPTRSPSKGLPIRSLTLRLPPPTAIWNCPPIAPTPPVASCRPTESGQTR